MELEWNAKIRSARVKPREQWMDGVKRSMNSRRLTEEHAKDIIELLRRRILLN
jgi:hypothetical protein